MDEKQTKFKTAKVRTSIDLMPEVVERVKKSGATLGGLVVRGLDSIDFHQEMGQPEEIIRKLERLNILITAAYKRIQILESKIDVSEKA